jgi:hypothetical protein
VNFVRYGADYNEQGIEDTIREAMRQIATTAKEENLASALQTIGLWFSNISVPMLLSDDAINVQLGGIPHRYYLFDWAFSEFPKLTAIILF